VRFHATGKVSLDHIYTQPDPRAYFRTLYELDYRIPQLVKPYFAGVIRGYRDARGVPTPTVLDIGSSYGINAALLKCGTSMDELYERYRAVDLDDAGVDALLARDQKLAASRPGPRRVRFTGLDASGPALGYALRAGFLDDAIHADLEHHEPTAHQLRLLAAADLVISTGCFGYITDRTLSRVTRAHGDGPQPWMAHCVLRMFPFAQVAERLAAAGYETVRVERIFRQRRFASPEEREQVLDTLSAAGIDPTGVETEGWLCAQLHISRPRSDALTRRHRPARPRTSPTPEDHRHRD
jgi:carnitine O-acetyltransferase